MLIQKFLILLCALCFIELSACKNAATPKNVGNTEGSANIVFAKQFPKAQEVTWDSSDVGMVATFTDGKNICKAFYDVNNKFQYVAILLAYETLPKTIQEFITKKYKGAIIAIAQQVNDGDHKIYQVEIETGTDYMTLEFDAKGNFLKEIKQPLSNEELQRQEEEGVDETEK